MRVVEFRDLCRLCVRSASRSMTRLNSGELNRRKRLSRGRKSGTAALPTLLLTLLRTQIRVATAEKQERKRRKSEAGTGIGTEEGAGEGRSEASAAHLPERRKLLCRWVVVFQAIPECKWVAACQDLRMPEAAARETETEAETGADVASSPPR
eukprot:COSAG05_NODE_59_length_23169_cov_37.393698_10_plen_153_part_00